MALSRPVNGVAADKWGVEFTLDIAKIPALGTSVNVSFEEAVFGCEKEIELNFREMCETCHGTGAKEGTQPETCSRCNGTGRVRNAGRMDSGCIS